MSANLKFHGHLPASILKKLNSSGKKGYWSETIKANRLKVVKHAIRKHCSPTLQDKIFSRRRSKQSDSKLIEDFLQFEQPEIALDRDYHYTHALKVVTEAFRPKQLLRPIHFPDQRYYPWTLNVSAEAPWTYETGVNDIIRQKQAEGSITDERRSFHNLYNEIFVRNRLLIHLIKERDQKFFDHETGEPKSYEFVTLHSRSHVVDEDEPDKIRAVFGVTKLLLMAEQHFIWPLQEQYLNNKVNSPLLWGNEMIKGGWRKLHQKVLSKSKYSTALGIDWSKFDKRALHSIIDDVHKIWRSYFTFDEGYVPTNFYPNSMTEAHRIENLWDWMCYSIKHTPIALPDGRLYSWTRNGIASGFQQTQLLDSFVNAIMLLTTLSESGVNIESENFLFLIQGDDSLVTFPEQYYLSEGQSYLNRLAEIAMKRFNAVLSKTKSYISDTLNGIKVLGYSNILCQPFRTDEDLLSHLVYPERSFGLPQLAATAVGIAWASLGCSRTVYNVCKDVHSFLTEKLEIKPKAQVFEWLEKMGTLKLEDYHLDRFPSYIEIFNSTFSVEIRTRQMKERLYPTLSQSAGGFVFLPY
jgi:hypothetical protein